MIETYKILNRYYNMDPSTPFTLNISSSTRGHLLKLFKKRSRLLILLGIIFSNIVNLWNSLPDLVVSAPTVATFKQQFDDYCNQSRYGHTQCGLQPSLAIVTIIIFIENPYNT